VGVLLDLAVGADAVFRSVTHRSNAAGVRRTAALQGFQSSRAEEDPS